MGTGKYLQKCGGNIGKLHAKEYDPTTILYHAQKLTQNGWDWI